MANGEVQSVEACAEPLCEIWEDEGEDATYHGIVKWDDLGPDARSILGRGVGERFQLGGTKYIVRVG